MSEPLRVGGVVGEVIDKFKPTVTMKVTYNCTKQVHNAHELMPSVLTLKPRAEVGGIDMRTFYTLIMTDPDAPSPTNPHLREHLHWLVTDIPGTTEASFGKELMEYESPNPHLGIHRYVFVLFKQKERETVKAAPSSKDNFNTRKFSGQWFRSPCGCIVLQCTERNSSKKKKITTNLYRVYTT